MRWTLLFAAAAAATPALAQGPRHFEIEASFEAASEPGKPPAVAVRFAPLDPDVQVNEIPAPRLELDDSQSLLSPAPAEPHAPVPPMSADAPRYLDLSEPVRFPVELAADAPAGIHGVPAEVVYFYCSKSRGWCRRGDESVTIPILVSR